MFPACAAPAAACWRSLAGRRRVQVRTSGTQQWEHSGALQVLECGGGRASTGTRGTCSGWRPPAHPAAAAKRENAKAAAGAAVGCARDCEEADGRASCQQHRTRACAHRCQQPRRPHLASTLRQTLLRHRPPGPQPRRRAPPRASAWR